MTPIDKLKYAIEVSQGLSDMQSVRGGDYPKLIHGDLKVSGINNYEASILDTSIRLI